MVKNLFSVTADQVDPEFRKISQEKEMATLNIFVDREDAMDCSP